MHPEREKGFTLIEAMMATAIMIVILGTTVGALSSAVQATQGVTMLADTQDNLRASMNYMVRDIQQAGIGIPQGGITIPANKIIWPATGGKFPATWTVIPAISPGYQMGPITSTSSVHSDLVTVIYADNTLQDTMFSPAHWLNQNPVNVSPCTGGSITSSGTSPNITTTLVFDATNCIHINTGNTELNVGDLILLESNSGGCSGDTTQVDTASCDANDPGTSLALRVVTAVNYSLNSITFAPGDAFGLNGTALPSTSTITAQRIWMITYYIDNSNSLRPQLMRQVNLNTAKAVGDVIENMQLFYDMVNVNATPPALLSPAEQENPSNTTPSGTNLPYIRDVYIYLFARSDSKFLQTGNYVRNNLESVVSVRGLSFYNEYN